VLLHRPLPRRAAALAPAPAAHGAERRDARGDDRRGRRARNRLRAGAAVGIRGGQLRRRAQAVPLALVQRCSVSAETARKRIGAKPISSDAGLEAVGLYGAPGFSRGLQIKMSPPAPDITRRCSVSGARKALTTASQTALD